MNTTEEEHLKDLERIKLLRYLDDDFMTVCLAGNFAAVELILKIVLCRDDIKIKSLRTQEQLKNLQGRSAILDVHAIGNDNKEFDVEIQRADKGADAKRARHNSSLLDAHILKPGDKTEDIPDTYIIFITENDVMKAGKPIYNVERYISIGADKELFGDGSHIVYVNGKYRGDDAIGKLMHDFSCTNPDDMHYEALAERARYFKRDEKGAETMCQVLEDMKNEVAERVAKEVAEKAAREAAKTARETAERMIQTGKLSFGEIALCIPSLSVAELKQIAAGIAPSA